MAISLADYVPPFIGILILVYLMFSIPNWVANCFYRPIHQTPELPYVVYWPKHDVVCGIIVGLTLCVLGYLIHYPWITEIMLLSGGFLAICCAVALRKGIKLIVISTDGVWAHLTGQRSFKKQFVPWAEVLSIEPYDLRLQYNTISYIKLALIGDRNISFICYLKGNAKEDLLNWLREYLSRYGGSAKQL